MRQLRYARLREQLREAKLRAVQHTRRSAQPIAEAVYLTKAKEPSSAELARLRRNARRRDQRGGARCCP